MSLDVQIKIEGDTQAVSASKRVEDALGRVEDKGPQVGASLQRGFEQAAHGAQGLTRQTESLARASETHARLNNALAQSFAGVAAQIQRESSMLSQIRGPIQQYEQDVRTLNSLMSQGKITAAEYWSQLDKVKARAQSAGALGPTPGAKGAVAPSLGGGVASSLGGLAASAGIAFSAKEALDLADSYTSLENRLRMVTGSQGELDAAMRRTHEIANATRSDWSTTGEAYVKLTQATKEMGLSHERAFKITETLNMALQSSGASATEAASGTLQLMQALRSGRLAGDEFRSVSENMPILLDVLSKQLNVTTGDLKNMGAEGKLTTDIIVTALESASDKIHSDFLKTVPTAAQQWTIFKNDMQATVGAFVQNTNIIPKLGEALHSLASALTTVVDVVSTVGTGLSGLADSLGVVGDGIKVALQPFGALNEILNGSNMFMDMYRQKLQEAADEWKNATPEGQRFNATLIAQLEITRMLALANPGLVAGIKKTADAWGDSRSTLAQWRDEVLGGVGLVQEWGEKTKTAYDKARKAGHDFNEERLKWEGYSHALPPPPKVEEMKLGPIAPQGDPAIDAWMKAQRAMLPDNNSLTNMWNRELDELTKRSKQFEDDMRSIGTSIGQSLAQGAFDGRMEWDKLLKSVTLAMAKAGAMQALRAGGLDTSLLGGIRIPGFASGGSFTVGGHGGTDTTPIAFMATPGERVTVETGGQQAKNDERLPAHMPLNLAIHLDERDAVKAFDTPAFERMTVRVVRRNQAALRGQLSGR